MPATNRHAAPKPARVTYSISDLAREFALTTRAIRFYEDCGLLTPARDKRTRVYG
jgi:DNA-binding transcriptional MerR regulator